MGHPNCYWGDGSFAYDALTAMCIRLVHCCCGKGHTGEARHNVSSCGGLNANVVNTHDLALLIREGLSHMASSFAAGVSVRSRVAVPSSLDTVARTFSRKFYMPQMVDTKCCDMWQSSRVHDVAGPAVILNEAGNLILESGSGSASCTR